MKISKEISNRSWGDADKSAIWQRLKRGLEEGEDGITSAIREMYAVVKAPINSDLREADCFGPHHEIRGDTLVLNRGGVVACYAALRGARAEPDLSPEQKSKGVSHIMRHYKELELETPENEMEEISAEVSGEMSIDDIPVASWAKLEELKKDDNNPLEVVVAIPTSTSKRGWKYTPEALQKIVNYVNEQGLHGYLGHQEPEKVNNEFPKPVTHWVGAKFQDNTAYIRGVIDKSAEDLKRWIKGNVVRTVSVFGIPTLKTVNGETQVVDYAPLSIDWTPIGRNGMPTRIVAQGEMNGGENKLTKEEILEGIKELEIPVGEILQNIGNYPSTKSVADTSYRKGELKLPKGIEEELNEAGKYIQAREIVGELEKIYGLEGEDLLNKIRGDRDVSLRKEKEERERQIDKLVGEMVTVEEIRPVVKLLVGEMNTEEDIKKTIGEILEREEIKKLIDTLYTDKKIAGKVTETSQVSTYKEKI